jgi:hypothetical protein
MALPEKRNELNQVDEQTTLNRLDEERGSRVNKDRIEEHYAAEDREYRARHEGHDFAKDMHPERYPREGLSRLEEGILEDDEVRHAHDHLGYSRPDVEHRIDDIRSLSRTLLTLGSFLLIFAGVLLLWVGWDLRSGQLFFTTMCGVAGVLGLGLIVWGFVERQRIAGLFGRMAEERDNIRTERDFRESDRAA